MNAYKKTIRCTFFFAIISISHLYNNEQKTATYRSFKTQTKRSFLAKKPKAAHPNAGVERITSRFPVYDASNETDRATQTPISYHACAGRLARANPQSADEWAGIIAGWEELLSHAEAYVAETYKWYASKENDLLQKSEHHNHAHSLILREIERFEQTMQKAPLATRAQLIPLYERYQDVLCHFFEIGNALTYSQLYLHHSPIACQIGQITTIPITSFWIFWSFKALHVAMDSIKKTQNISVPRNAQMLIDGTIRKFDSSIPPLQKAIVSRYPADFACLQRCIYRYNLARTWLKEFQKTL